VPSAGIGAYTGAAIASIACGERAAVVDANVVRVLARLLKIGWALGIGKLLDSSQRCCTYMPRAATYLQLAKDIPVNASQVIEATTGDASSPTHQSGHAAAARNTAGADNSQWGL
jgi:hypothetical protein